MEKGTEVTLCGGRYWCPTLKFDGEMVSITDDDDNKVQMEPESWNDLVDKIQDGTLNRIP